MTMILSGTNGGTFPSWTTAGRPASPAVGQMGYNTTTGAFDAYTAAGWTTVTSNKTAGSVLQVVQTVKVDTYSSTANTWTDVTGVSLSITPAAASNKVLVSFNLVAGSSSASPDLMLRIVRDSTPIALGNSGGTDQVTIVPFSTAATATTETYRSMANTVQYLDSPATTSAVTYKIQMRNWSTTDSYFVGRRGLNSSFIQPTFLTAMEIAA